MEQETLVQEMADDLAESLARKTAALRVSHGCTNFPMSHYISMVILSDLNVLEFFLTFTATHYLPSYTPHVGPLDAVTFKEAGSLLAYMSIRPTSGVTPVFFFYILLRHTWVLWYPLTYKEGVSLY